MLSAFVLENRAEVLARARLRSAPCNEVSSDRQEGFSRFLEQLARRLRDPQASDVDEQLRACAIQYGTALLRAGVSATQVVHDYGALCDALTELAVERGLHVTEHDFQIITRCIEDSIAEAVGQYVHGREVEFARAEAVRMGMLAHEQRNLLTSALLAFRILERTHPELHSDVFNVLSRSLNGLRALNERSLTEVRLARSVSTLASVPLGPLVEELAAAAMLAAQERRVHVCVECVVDEVCVETDRLLLSSVVSNLLQNAVKFTRAGGQISLRVCTAGAEARIEVEDECGGLPSQDFGAFRQHGTDRSGLGLGLSIARNGAERCGGRLDVRDLPGRGCIFAVALPLPGVAALH